MQKLPKALRISPQNTRLLIVLAVVLAAGGVLLVSEYAMNVSGATDLADASPTTSPTPVCTLPPRKLDVEKHKEADKNIAAAAKAHVEEEPHQVDYDAEFKGGVIGAYNNKRDLSTYLKATIAQLAKTHVMQNALIPIVTDLHENLELYPHIEGSATDSRPLKLGLSDEFGWTSIEEGQKFDYTMKIGAQYHEWFISAAASADQCKAAGTLTGKVLVGYNFELWKKEASISPAVLLQSGTTQFLLKADHAF